jgi:nickel-dependent lactate racemase
LTDVPQVVRAALNDPSDFPPLAAACVPGDRAVLVLDRGVACAADVVGEVVRTCCDAGADPNRLTILQPADWRRRAAEDPRSRLPNDLRAAVAWAIHDPTRADSTGYLASTSTGERVYLARDLLDADLVIPLYAAGFDSVLGYRGPGNLFYPGLSTLEALARSRGEGHPELRPEDDRPLRQLGDEISWLLGIQFAVCAAPGRGAGTVAAVWAGQVETVQRQAQQFVNHTRRIQLDRRAETVVVAVSGPAGRVGWEEVGSALEAAQHLVVRDGRILILSSLQTPPGPGMEIVRASRSAKAALQRLRKESPPDLVPSVQTAAASDWARVFLFSQLAPSVVEDLMITPVESLAQVERWIGLADDVVFIDGGEYVWGEIASD